MAKTIVAGKAIIIESTLKFEDILKVKKYRPEALTLFGGEDGKEPIFVVTTGDSGNLNKFGATFTDASRDSGKAILTMATSYDGDEVTEYISDKLGAGLIKLGKLEESLPSVVLEIDREKAAVESSITVMM